MPTQKPGMDCATIASASTARPATGRRAPQTPRAMPSPAASASDQPSSTSVAPTAGQSTALARTA